VKRQKLMKHLRKEGCVALREGGRHTVVQNPKNEKQSAVPRHREIPTPLVEKICKDLDVPPPSES
jgi:predicted RNA binding protein YcfA (HicA-like mRNA interferase family)